MLEERPQQALLALHLEQRRSNRSTRVQHVVGDEVGQVGALRLAPHLFVGIEFWSVGRQLLDRQSRSVAGQQLFRRAAVD